MSAKLGEILVRENLITSTQLRETLEYQRANGGRLGSNLVRLGFVSDDVVRYKDDKISTRPENRKSKSRLT